MYFIHGLIFGIFVFSKDLLLSLKMVHFINLLQSLIFTTKLTSLRKWIIGITSLIEVDNAIHSALVVKSTISFYSLDFQVIE